MRKRNKKLIKELVQRRDETLKRAIKIANKNIPEHLIDSQLPEIIEWIIEPHIREHYTEYKNTEDKKTKTLQQIIQKTIPNCDKCGYNKDKDCKKGCLVLLKRGYKK